MLGRLAEALFTQIERGRAWHRLPGLPLRVAALHALRRGLRRLNLHDTQRGGFPRPEREYGPETYRLGRTEDGSYNDLGVPAMGARLMRFGRNAPVDALRIPTARDILEPNPREVSRRLLARRDGAFQPIPHLNVLAAAWMQFMAHDWFAHPRDPDARHEIPLAEDDDFPARERALRFPRSQPDRESYPDRGLPPAFVNGVPHWWHCGQIYGHDEARRAALRTGQEGKLRLGADGRLALGDDGLELTGAGDNWWIGVSILHTLFTREHNSVCDRLIASYPARRRDDAWLFEKARLVTIALMAKINTVEWLPALCGEPAVRLLMRGDWWGAFGETFRRERGRLSPHPALQGIPGAPTAHDDVPYAMTEEFVAVCRMHTLLPDTFDFRSAFDDRPIPGAEALDFRAVSGPRLAGLRDVVPLADAAYSLGTRSPGAMRLHNYPAALSRLAGNDAAAPHEEDGMLDLGTIDIVRDREHGVPRYNDFRRMLRMLPAPGIGAITSDRQRAAEIEAVYGGDVERVDTLIGLLAEDLLPGAALPDTALRVFLLMTARRLRSDRFFTVDYTPDMYTPEGLDWIDRASLRDIVLRHLPEVEPALRGVRNAFFKWRESKPQ